MSVGTVDSQNPDKKSTGKSKGFSVALNATAYHNVVAHSKKLKMSKSEYASAAIAFFAESGMNPTAERPVGLSTIEVKVAEQTRRIRDQNIEIANRVISILRGWEKSSYAFHQQQQQSLHIQLELIESNLLQYLVALETNLLKPMVDELFKTNIESFIGRGLGEQIFIKVMGESQDVWPRDNDRYNAERDRIVVEKLRDFMKTNTVPTPQPTTKRPAIPTPARTPVPPTTAPGAKAVLS